MCIELCSPQNSIVLQVFNDCKLLDKGLKGHIFHIFSENLELRFSLKHSVGDYFSKTLKHFGFGESSENQIKTKSFRWINRYEHYMHVYVGYAPSLPINYWFYCCHSSYYVPHWKTRHEASSVVISQSKFEELANYNLKQT